MIVKRHFTAVSMWPYVRLELGLAAASSTTAWLLVDRAGWTQWTLPAAIATVLGTALSILLAVRANTSYQRWWEGSAIWAQVVGLCRNVVRIAVSVSNSKPDADPAAVRAFQNDIAQRQIAYATALRTQLRGHDPTDLAAHLAHLDPPERDVLLAADNTALMLLAGQSARIFTAYRDGILTGLDNFQMETSLAGLSTQQALAERISMQPVPRTYDVFSRYLVHLYSVVFPFAVIETLPAYRWLIIPATLIIAFAFRIVERIGSVLEAPFGNTTQDAPSLQSPCCSNATCSSSSPIPSDPPRPHRPTDTSGDANPARTAQHRRRRRRRRRPNPRARLGRRRKYRAPRHPRTARTLRWWRSSRRSAGHWRRWCLG